MNVDHVWMKHTPNCYGHIINLGRSLIITGHGINNTISFLFRFILVLSYYEILFDIYIYNALIFYTAFLLLLCYIHCSSVEDTDDASEGGGVASTSFIHTPFEERGKTFLQ